MARKQSLNEIDLLKAKIAELEKSEIDRKKAEESLKESEEKYRAIFESLHDVYYRTDREGRITIISPSVRAQAGYDPEEIIGHQVTDFYLNPSDRKIFKTKLKEFGIINDYELQLKTKDGRVIEVSTSSKIIYGEDGSPVGMEGVLRDVTERKKAEDALQTLEEKFSKAFHNNPIPIYITTIPDGVFTDVNSMVEKLSGFKRDEIIGKTSLELDFYEKLEDRDKLFQQLQKDGKLYNYEISFRIKSGEFRFCRVFSEIIEIQGKPHLLSMILDITERKQAEEELHESEERFRNLMEQSPVAIQILTPDGRTVSVNTAYKKIWGLSEEVLSQLYEKYNLLQDEQARKLGIMPLFEKAFAGEAVILPPVEYDALDTMKTLDFTKAKGKKRWIQNRLYPVKNENGEIMNVVLMLENITERKKAEEELQKREAQQALVLKSLPMAFYIAQPFGDYGGTWVSDQIGKISSFTAEQFMNDIHLWASRLHPEDRDRVLDEFDKVLEKEAIDIEYRWQSSDGKYLWFFDSGVLIRDEKGKPIEIIGTWLDITERKQAENALRESEKKFSSIVESSPMGMHIYSLEPDGKLIFSGANPAADILLGVDNSQFIGKTIEEAFPPLSDTEIPGIYREVASHGKRWHTEQVIYKDEKISGAFEVHAFQTSPGKMVALFMDITERKQAEEALLKSKEQLRALAARLEEVEEAERKGLAQELHDRVGQNLSALNINLNIMHSQLSAESTGKIATRLADSMTLVQEATEHIRDVMADLRPQVLDDYGLMAALRWYGERFSERTGVSTEVRGKELTPRLPHGVETAFFRIAQEAMTNVAKHADANQATVTLEEVDGLVRLIIADDGVGFDLTDLSPRERPGWGLITMKERAKALDGQVLIESEPDKGTRVAVEVKR